MAPPKSSWSRSEECHAGAVRKWDHDPGGVGINGKGCYRASETNVGWKTQKLPPNVSLL